MSEWLDDCGDYPTEAALARIAQWPAEGSSGCLDFAREIWHWPDLAGERLTPHEREVVHADEGDRFARFATGGWSGNEDIIAALMANWMVRALWQMSGCGGLHIFQYPDVEQPKSMPHTPDLSEPGMIVMRGDNPLTSRPLFRSVLPLPHKDLNSALQQYTAMQTAILDAEAVANEAGFPEGMYLADVMRALAAGRDALQLQVAMRTDEPL